MAKQAAGPPPMPFAWIALFPPRVVRDLVAHHREHDVAQLPRHGRDGHAVGLALGALPVVEGAQPCVSSRGFEQKDHRKLSSLSIGSAHAF